MNTNALTNLSELAAVSIRHETKPIQLIVSDIEGCLNLNEHTYDLEALSWIRTVNQLAQATNPLPFITVCSGRQHAFVEAITQILAGQLPAIFENGCGLYFPTRGLFEEYAWHPLLSQPELFSRFTAVKQRILDEVVTSHQARRVPGKEMMLSLHPIPPVTVEHLYNDVTEILTQCHELASVTRSASAVDVTPAGIDKAAGVRWLVDMLKETFPVQLANIAGIGDSIGDLPFLSIVGLSSAPANASEQVKKSVSYYSPLPDGRGVADIIQHCITLNMQPQI